MKLFAAKAQDASRPGPGARAETEAGTLAPGLASSLLPMLGNMGPAWLVLAAGLAASSLSSPVAAFIGAQDSWQVIWRFLRLCLVVALPVLALPWLCSLLGWWLNRGNRQLLAAPQETAAGVGRLSLWLLRPWQGLGLLLLAASKVLVLLQLYTGSGLNATDLPYHGQHFSRLLLTVWGAGVATSLLLSALWTLDDLHLRLYNAKTGEVRQIGRYLGVVLPIAFGLYGIYNVFADNAHLPALRMTIRMVVVFYPVFVVLSVLHTRLLQGWRGSLLLRLGPSPGQMVFSAEEVTPPSQGGQAQSAFPPPSKKETCDESQSS